MHGVTSHAAVRCLTLPRHAPLARHLPQLVADVAGELQAIHPGAPRYERIVRLETIAGHYSTPLADRWRALRMAGTPPDPEGATLLAAEARMVSALQAAFKDGLRVLDAYDPHQSGDEIPRMRAPQAQELRHESQSTLRWLMQQGPTGIRVAATYAASLEPALRPAYVGDALRGGHASSPKQGDTQPPRVDHRRPGSEGMGLSEAQALALRLYAHDGSGAFNLLRACDDLHQLIPGEPVTRGFDEVAVLVQEAAQALYQAPQARVWGRLLKGMQAPLREAWQAGREIAVTRPYSVTTLESESYAGRVVRGTVYDQELVLQDAPALRTRAVLIAAFHPVKTARQAEALVLPGQVYRIVDSERREGPPLREGGSMAIVRHVATKTGDAPPGEAAARR